MRYRLRTLLIVVSLVGILLGLRVNAARKQARAVASLERLQVHVVYDFEADGKGDRKGGGESWMPRWVLARTGLDLFHDVVAVESAKLGRPMDLKIAASRTEEARAIAKELSAFRTLKVVWLRDLKLGDDLLQSLEKQHRLRKLLLLPAPEVTDAGIRHLRHLQSLREVAISYSKMTDAALETFGQMQNLEGLHLQGHSFTDAGIAALSDLVQLRELSVGLGSPAITDDGLLVLSRLKSLESIDLQDSQVTDSGIAKLQESLPKLREVFRPRRIYSQSPITN